jgi:hypothetical protein
MDGNAVSRAPGLRVSPAVLTPLLCLAVAGAGANAVTLADVMRRVHEYVAVYEDHELSTIMAHERYHQQWLDAGGSVKQERTMLSDYLLVQLPDEDWVAVRDPHAVDGEAIAARGARLKALFAGPREQLGERVMALALDSARFNLGDLYHRTLNLPTFALRVLRPVNRKRIAFEKVGEEHVDGVATWVIAFREAKGPTFSATTEGADVPAHGRFWVEPDTGAVLRSEMILGGSRRLPSRATITVTYGREPSLGFRIPTEMRERYDNPRRKRADVVVASATYSDFRRFDWRTLLTVPPVEPSNQP